MSHDAVNWAIIHAVYPDEVKPAARWLLVQICDRADNDSFDCFPSHKTLARDAGMSPRSVLALLQILEDHKIVARTPRFREGGTRTTDLILVTGYEEYAAQRGKTRIDQPQEKARPTAKVAAHNLVSEPRKRTSDEANASLLAVSPETREAFDAFNALVDEIGSGARASRLTDDRRRRIAARLKECGGLPGWREALARVRRSDFLCGKTDGGFCITLDFLIQPSSFTKLMEGFYERIRNDRGSPASVPSADRGRAQHDERLGSMQSGAMEALDRRRRWRLGGAADRAE